MEGGLGAPRRFMLMLLSGREGGGVDSRNIGLCLSASAIVQGGGRGTCCKWAWEKRLERLRKSIFSVSFFLSVNLYVGKRGEIALCSYLRRKDFFIECFPGRENEAINLKGHERVNKFCKIFLRHVFARIASPPAIFNPYCCCCYNMWFYLLRMLLLLLLEL